MTKPKRLTAAELAGSAPADDAPPEPSAPPVRKPAKRTPPRNARIAPLPPMQGSMVRALEQRDYLPDPHRHLSEMGPVATSNFICRIGGTRISVRMGAPRSTLPKELQAMMAEHGVGFAHAQPPARKGAMVVEPEESYDGPPRARRTSRKRDRDRDAGDRTFAPIRTLPTE